ncbi:G-type lectin S-receptor-like serine/threonine-protein kinase At1g34300 [Humulus lupulus]|uniref:G-type lectin S-receptor-like serine/threonine-protein kinase At1g34300 n=1 Tax=Humulus lupulus TaxID=3486 RepID=UPI002B408AD9|nr:G-type lectin S-receptor-like serine/threonine-protein kinase At1g34300 [Humulus lupulus]
MNTKLYQATTFTFVLFFFFFASLVSAQNQTKIIRSFSSSNSPWRPSSNQTLISPNSTFAAGFKPGLNGFTFSIWYLNVTGTDVVWSTDKNGSSFLSSSAVLSISSTGELRLQNSSSGANLWPGNATGNLNTTLTLGGDGNLVFGNWESFKFPTDTILPNQNITNTELVSRNGKFRFQKAINLVFNSSDRYWTANNAFVKLDSDGKMEQANSGSLITSDFGPNLKRRLTLDDDGNLRIYGFDPDLREWTEVWHATHELCTIHGSCGPNSICTSDGSNSSSCVCPPGFLPGAGGDPKKGCERKIRLRDMKKTKFIRLDYVNFTASNEVSLSGAANLSDCELNCTRSMNCLGFMLKYDGRGSCFLKNDDNGLLVNGYWSPGTESAMFLRVDQSETDQSNFKGMTEILETTCPIKIELPLPPDESNSTTRNIVIICTLFAAELISGALFFWAFLKKYVKYRDMARTLGLELLPAGGPKRFSYAELKTATKDFSNLIGKGGFGDVYKGELPDHRVVAVKCLKNVAGGEPDFWAEVTIIARMHHLNLVRLWGFCAEKGQRILVYEYVRNGSLDRYLFSSNRSGSEETKPVLDWNIRYRIALGVARAIAYLHEECLEWVLHCDIKPENILLGDEFCPKISDFGLSKLRKKEAMVSLSKIRGTRGYMAPEWVKSDSITAKADVYSFGMVLLEMVSGVRNNQIQGSAVESDVWYFPGWAFDKVYKEVNVEDILDIHIKQSYDSRAHFEMVNRMVQTAMWCLQSRPEMRPSMGKVAKMLEGTVEITQPSKPTIFFLGDDDQ